MIPQGRLEERDGAMHRPRDISRPKRQLDAKGGAHGHAFMRKDRNVAAVRPRERRRKACEPLDDLGPPTFSLETVKWLGHGPSAEQVTFVDEFQHTAACLKGCKRIRQ